MLAAAHGEAELRDAYCKAALRGDRATALRLLLDALSSGVPIANVYRNVLVAAQRAFGELWADARITVAEEHAASAVTQTVLGRLYGEIHGRHDAGRALIAGVEGELHTLPAQLAADLLEMEGWDVTFLGTHVPTASLLAALEAAPFDVLGLSVTLPTNALSTLELARAVRARHPQLPIVIGGRAAHVLTGVASALSLEIDRGDLQCFARLRPRQLRSVS